MGGNALCGAAPGGGEAASGPGTGPQVKPSLSTLLTEGVWTAPRSGLTPRQGTRETCEKPVSQKSVSDRHTDGFWEGNKLIFCISSDAVRPAGVPGAQLTWDGSFWIEHAPGPRTCFTILPGGNA